MAPIQLFYQWKLLNRVGLPWHFDEYRWACIFSQLSCLLRRSSWVKLWEECCHWQVSCLNREHLRMAQLCHEEPPRVGRVALRLFTGVFTSPNTNISLLYEKIPRGACCQSLWMHQFRQHKVFLFFSMKNLIDFRRDTSVNIRFSNICQNCLQNWYNVMQKFHNGHETGCKVEFPICFQSISTELLT